MGPPPRLAIDRPTIHLDQLVLFPGFPGGMSNSKRLRYQCVCIYRIICIVRRKRRSLLLKLFLFFLTLLMKCTHIIYCTYNCKHIQSRKMITLPQSCFCAAELPSKQPFWYSRKCFENSVNKRKFYVQILTIHITSRRMYEI